MMKNHDPLWSAAVSASLSLLAFAFVSAVAPEVLAQASRVTNELNTVATEVNKWKESAQTIFTAAVGIAGCVTGYLWWEERGKGRESAKGLIMGIFFALAVAPWMASCAKGCVSGG